MSKDSKATQARNKELVENLVTALCDIKRTENRGDILCFDKRERFRKLISEVLTQLDGVKAPFEKGDSVRLRRKLASSSYSSDLVLGKTYEVYEVEYDGEGYWLVTLTEMKDRADQVRFGSHQFEKVKAVRVA
ncbi:MAG: hypothetical protein UY47_C0004G0032 [Parcubacteria group bacterium GW2011_GWB1_49_7]|uniref:Uncharacterized protein n=1 Tax=Candidatus Zambryskibacteria bacterium RIFCSPHIGHO2_01_FULL_46_25 TaxID=1802738 RepID=A0A1G2T038_9BACT|nr:MAG: hypothetical protein UX71_C0002G0080 [Parcubacteria group bacterium GW2011_GWA1_47_10]KKW09858.1 MAG: hypothetical protein UY47_C0004G0032 [Parcubacteria group bacterium GW2011_GWB1_49_7]OHA90633.1 MAG: hypothetical protein A2838_02865 [Candidatus Zambryskibacteria bacterium RIFCSPHIGHO2_01_FULL_46_25]OHB07276.1 MAG: hypothetical protein A3A31_02005 [Candidatus Zambryskibacteria bacterium RIFCSPLOWO2_01_FULL_48_25]